MRHFLAVTLSVAMLAGASASPAADGIATLSVENMICPSCPYIVEQSLRRVEGVKSVDVSLQEKRAVVRYDDRKTNVEALIAATTRYGFPSSVVE